MFTILENIEIETAHINFNTYLILKQISISIFKIGAVQTVYHLDRILPIAELQVYKETYAYVCR